APLPLLARFSDRLRLKAIPRDPLPHEDRRCRIATATGLLLLLKNLLVCREPLYGIGEWAARHVPELLGLCPAQLPSLNDDRVGRCLDRLFDADIPTLALAVVVQAVREFAVDLDELHNDSTTITFHGDYESAERERTLRGRLRLAVTWGHNKDHRPLTRPYRSGRPRRTGSRTDPGHPWVASRAHQGFAEKAGGASRFCRARSYMLYIATPEIAKNASQVRMSEKKFGPTLRSASRWRR